jgi:hypothetical protein
MNTKSRETVLFGSVLLDLMFCDFSWNNFTELLRQKSRTITESYKTNRKIWHNWRCLTTVGICEGEVTRVHNPHATTVHRVTGSQRPTHFNIGNKCTCLSPNCLSLSVMGKRIIRVLTGKRVPVRQPVAHFFTDLPIFRAAIAQSV